MNPDLVAFIASLVFIVVLVFGAFCIWGPDKSYESIRTGAILYGVACIMGLVGLGAHLAGNDGALWIAMDFVKIICAAGGTGMVMGRLHSMTKPPRVISKRERAKIEREQADAEAKRIQDEIMRELHKAYPLDTPKHLL